MTNLATILQSWDGGNMPILKARPLRLREVRFPRQPGHIAWKGARWMRAEFVKFSTDAFFSHTTP